MSKNSNKTYYLPEDVQGWIERKASEDNRSPSNFLANLLSRQMQKEAAGENTPAA